MMSHFKSNSNNRNSEPRNVVGIVHERTRVAAARTLCILAAACLGARQHNQNRGYESFVACGPTCHKPVVLVHAGYRKTLAARVKQYFLVPHGLAALADDWCWHDSPLEHALLVAALCAGFAHISFTPLSGSGECVCLHDSAGDVLVLDNTPASRSTIEALAARFAPRDIANNKRFAPLDALHHAVNKHCRGESAEQQEENEDEDDNIMQRRTTAAAIVQAIASHVH